MCKVKDCEKEVYCRGYCSKHYNRLIKKGTIEDSLNSRASLEERFWRRVKKTDNCWIWTGSPSSTGYGLLGVGGRNGKKVGVHRISYELHNGEIPKINEYHGAVIMHTCDNRLCVNPDHLIAGSQSDNVKDMDLKGRRITSPSSCENHGNSKFTNEQVKQIKESTLNNAELGRIFNVPRQTIRYIKKQGWRNI